MGFHVLQVLERQPDQAPRFEDVRTQVLAEFRRRAGDAALRQYIAELRQHADIVVPSPLSGKSIVLPSPASGGGKGGG
jgi:hypothetical protein